MLNRKDSAKMKALQDQLRVSVVQAISQITGPEHVIKVLSQSQDLADLHPRGQNISLKMSIDIYEKDKE